MSSDKPDESQPRRRKRRRDTSAFETAYEAWTFPSIESSGRPGTPHRYFKDSFQIISPQKTESNKDHYQIIHRHANGLAIVTAGTLLKAHENQQVQSIDWKQSVSTVANESAATKRKQQAKMLKGKATEGTVQPHHILAEITLDNGTIVPLQAGVWGTILEINQQLTPQLLMDDPLLDGYLAVILPSGPFPPRQKSLDAEGTSESTNM